jgi:predicted nucleotidyltransferase
MEKFIKERKVETGNHSISDSACSFLFPIPALTIRRTGGKIQTMVTRKETITFLQNRERKRQQMLDERFMRAREDCKKIVFYIAAEYVPAKIWQWGSLLNRRFFTEKSDIDIGIEGLSSPEQIFTILSRAEELTDFPLDIIELEKVEPEFSELIKRKGKCVYEHGG